MLNAHTRTQNGYDKKIGVYRLDDICFCEDATENEIEAVFNEVKAMKLIAPALMTAGALTRYMELPKYVVDKMKSMEVGSNFVYKNVTITKWSENLYNGHNGDEK